MDGNAIIWLSLLGSLAFLLLILIRRGLSDPLVIMLSFYLFFAFGPVVNYLSGELIYFGIKPDLIPTASLIFFLATFGMAAVAWCIPLNREAFVQSTLLPRPLANILLPANLVMSALSLALLLRFFIGGGFGLDKIRSIALVGEQFHYLYLLIELYLTAFYFNIGREKSHRLAYLLNFGCYLFYCLAIGERDFIFTLLSIGIHWSLTRPNSRKQKMKLLLGGFLLTLGGTLIFVMRDGAGLAGEVGSPLTAILNQGSLLFVNTYTLHLLNNGTEYFWGMTYIYAFMNLLPSGIWSTGFNLPGWLRQHYAPESTSGYGYGLDAEGFLNFSWAGVLLTFVGLGLWQRKIFNLKFARGFALYLSVFSVAFTMYSLRNDSTALFKGHFYAVISYMALNFLSRFFGGKTEDLTELSSLKE